MEKEKIIHELSTNKNVFQSILQGSTTEQYEWKPVADKWSLLEIVCHLYDEEHEDFRARLKQTLHAPELPLPSIDPSGWVTQREYSKQDFNNVLSKFIAERTNSIQWLNTLPLDSPAWKNIHHHPKFGELSAEMFLANWLAHDYLHIRQIIKLKYDLLKSTTPVRFDYAGDW